LEKNSYFYEYGGEEIVAPHVLTRHTALCYIRGELRGERTMTSNAYAARLREIAGFLESRPEFEMPNEPYVHMHVYGKDDFVAIAKALGSGKKIIPSADASYRVKFHPTFFPEITVSIARDKVCTKIAEAIYKCEPFLSEAELETVGV
jgi:hypothetical protein